MAYFWDNSLTAESIEDFCSQVFIKMFITTITMVAELCTHFLKRKKGWRRVCSWKEIVPWENFSQNAHRKGERWRDGLPASPNLCPQMQGWQPRKHWRALSRMKPSSHPTHSPEQQDSFLPPPGCKSSVIYLQRVACLMESHPIPRILKSLVK